jgi:hypothetical protein
VTVSLPTAAGTVDPAVVTRFREATARCANYRTWTAEIAVTGTVRQRRVRLKVLAGTTDQGEVRLEGVAPFGGPVFVLTASGGRASLLLPRDLRVLRDEETGQVLDALVGIPLAAVDLHRLLSGCGLSGSNPENGRAFGDGWYSVEVGPHRTVFLLDRPEGIRVEAVRLDGLTAAYAFAGGAPREVRLVTDGTPANRAQLRLALSQIETNVDLAADTFRFDVPPGARPMSLAELEEWLPGNATS